MLLMIAQERRKYNIKLTIERTVISDRSLDFKLSLSLWISFYTANRTILFGIVSFP